MSGDDLMQGPTPEFREQMLPVYEKVTREVFASLLWTFSDGSRDQEKVDVAGMMIAAAIADLVDQENKKGLLGAILRKLEGVDRDH